MISLRHVTKRYGATEVVRDVTLDLPPGGVTALVGPNGAGKSTLLSMVGRLIPTDGGTVHVDGDDVATAPTERLARRLAILRQDNHLPVRLAVRELVAFGRYPHTRGRLDAHDLEHVDRALRLLELDNLADRRLDQLSGGQRQRAFIAMVLCQDTDYVLLDEPLNNLDVRHAVQTMDIVRQLADDHGRTLVVVVHDVNVAATYADRIVAMRDGAVVADGSPDEIVSSAVLRDVFDLDIPVHRLDDQPVALFFTRDRTRGAAP